MDVYSQQ